MRTRFVLSIVMVLPALLAGCSNPAPGQNVQPPAVSAEASKASPSPRMESQWKLNYLSPNSISVTSVLAPPPAPGSEASQADLKRMEALQESRTSQDCQRANEEVGATLGDFFGPSYGPLTEEEVATWSPFFAKVASDTSYFVREAKVTWNRARPYQEDPELKPCVPVEPTSAYPSGHAARARVFADVLVTLLPTQKRQIRRRAAQIAEDRVMGGVHHPSDIAASRKLGDVIFNALMNDPAFMRDLRDAAAAEEAR